MMKHIMMKWLKNERPMATSSSALWIMRDELERNIGTKRIKGFLVRFGWEMGVNDAKQALKQIFHWKH